ALVIILIFCAPAFWAFHNVEKITAEYKSTQPEKTTNSKTDLMDLIGDLKKTEKDVDEDEVDIDTLPPELKKTYLISISLVAFYMLFFYAYLPFVAVFGSLRYRVTHSRWRGIRGHMEGSTILYGLYGLFHLFLIIITFGLWIPMADLLKYKYKMNRISFGDQKAVFNPDYGNLFGINLLSFFGGIFIGIFSCIILAIIVYAIVPDAHAASEAVKEAKIDPDSAEGIIVGVATGIGVFVLFASIIMSRFWYKAAFVRMRYNYLTFGNIGFDCKISGWGLFRQTFGNLLIYIFTIGFGHPIVIQRKMKFFCKHTRIKGDMNNSPILQAIGKKDTAGEGVSSILDISIGLF
ncbi:MAG: DUF898 family protein, partial [Candidatus Berkiella sp.]